MNHIDRQKAKSRIRKWVLSMIRDKWGNLTGCHWNQLAMQEVSKLKSMLTTNP